MAIPPRELLTRGGRILLWLAVAVVLARGLAELTSTGPAPEPSGRDAHAATWPDDTARAFAIEFASAYLDHAHRHDPAAPHALQRFTSAELVHALTPRVNGHGRRQTVGSLAVADVERIDRSHALLTIAASISGDAPRVVRLTIPIARDRAGGLAVYDLPSLAPTPPRAAIGAPDSEPLTGAEGDAISDVLTRYFRAYLAGDTGGLAYLVPAGTRPTAATSGFELVHLESVAATRSASRGGRLMLATIAARDLTSRAVLALRYRVWMVRRERWYVAELNPGGGQ